MATTRGSRGPYHCSFCGKSQDQVRRLIAGPGSVGDVPSPSGSGITARDLLAASGPGVDRFSYHHYNTISPRCGGRDDPALALSEAVRDHVGLLAEQPGLGRPGRVPGTRELPVRNAKGRRTRPKLANRCSLLAP